MTTILTIKMTLAPNTEFNTFYTSLEREVWEAEPMLYHMAFSLPEARLADGVVSFQLFVNYERAVGCGMLSLLKSVLLGVEGVVEVTID